MPHLKRIINQQVFLEESDPYVRNQSAIEAAQQMLASSGYSGIGQIDITQSNYPMLPSLGPQNQPEGNGLFRLPHSSKNTQQAPTSYMTQG